MVQPILVAVPAATLALWESEWALWAPDTNVVPYSGSLASRTVLMDHELWLNASSLDGKLTGKLKDEMPPEVSPGGVRVAGLCVTVLVLPQCLSIRSGRFVQIQLSCGLTPAGQQADWQAEGRDAARGELVLDVRWCVVCVSL